MGSICGWSGTSLGPDMSQQAIKAMLAECGGNTSATSDSNYDDTGALGIREGLYTTSFLHQDGIRAAIIGSPIWDDKELSETATKHGAGAALIRAYGAYGKVLLSWLHGTFALAVQCDNEALIAIDRIGIHSLSYTLQERVFAFSSSTGSLVRHPLVSRRIDPQAIFNYLYFHDIPSPGTIFKGVEKLLPAQYIQFRNGKIDKGFYWKLHFDEHSEGSFQAHRQQFRELLRQAVATSSQDGPVATFLSGGTDSSTITGILAEIQENPVDSYSIGFGAEGFDELEYARLAAQRFGANADEYYLKPDDILEAIPLITRTYDDPFAND